MVQKYVLGNNFPGIFFLIFQLSGFSFFFLAIIYCTSNETFRTIFTFMSVSVQVFKIEFISSDCDAKYLGE